MRKVAFLGDPWSGTIHRACAFASQNLDIDFTFVNMPVWINDNFQYFEIKNELLCNIKLIKFESFDHTEFDLVLNLNDKHFEKILSYYAPSLKNLFNKNELNLALKSFGFDFLQTENFKLDDIVFVKPVFGSGQYCPPTDKFSYRVHSFKHVKHLNTKFFTIQEFINNPSIISVLFVSNGNDVEFLDVTDATYLFNENGKSLNTGVESRYNNKELYVTYINDARKLIYDVGYNNVKGIFMVQFLTDEKTGRKIICDFNMRTGPAADEVTINKLLRLQVHNTIKFMLGDARFADINVQPVQYRCYLEQNNKPLANIRNINYDERILIVGEKDSGLIRSDYETYIEKL